MRNYFDYQYDLFEDLNLNETTVVAYIKKWLQESSKLFDEDFAVDFLIRECASNNWLMDYGAIECKGTKSNFHRALGQCLDYHFIYDCIPIYLAIPKDYRSLKNVKQILSFFKLPIGVLLVDESGKVSKEIEAKGKIRCFKEYQDELGYYVHKPTQPDLHFRTK
jgi:hypothetical protein